jgi:general secretion pathway protein A
MYMQHWQLAEQPFENRCSSQFYYPAQMHQAAMLKLRYAIENRRSAAILAGPTGIGKTMLVQELRRQLSSPFRPICQLVYPALDVAQWLQTFVDAIDGGESTPANPAGAASQGSAAALRRFEHFLQANLDSGQHAVIVVDEAHLLEEHGLLEPLRLLLNVAADRAAGEAAWTLVLVGQEPLVAQVERYHALDERLAVKCLVNRFSPEETQGYIQHRLRAVGGDSQAIFTPDALEAIESLSQGLPRRINRLCDLALMIGYAEDLPRVTAEVIDSVHHELAPPLGS